MDENDAGMDPCECIGHEMTMRRLLNLLRRTQSYCTDTECFQDVVNSGNPNQDSSNIMLFGLFIAFAMLMFFLRPRNSMQRSIKSSPNNDHNNGSPPPNPPAPVL